MSSESVATMLLNNEVKSGESIAIKALLNIQTIYLEFSKQLNEFERDM